MYTSPPYTPFWDNIHLPQHQDLGFFHNTKLSMANRTSRRPRQSNPYPSRSTNGRGAIPLPHHASSRSVSHKPSRIFSHVISPFRSHDAVNIQRDVPEKENIGHGGYHLLGSDQDPLQAQPTQPTIYTRKPPPFLSNGLAPLASASNGNGPTNKRTSSVSTRGREQASTTITTSPDSVSTAGPLFEELKRLSEYTKSISPSPYYVEVRPRGTSSEYSPPGASPRIQSPVSPAGMHRLSLSDLSEFVKENDYLSNMCSSTSSSHPGSANADNSTHAAITDAAAVITEWQEERNASPCEDEDELPKRGHRNPSIAPPQTEHSTSEAASDPSIPRKSTSTSLRGAKYQLDGAADAERQKSPDISFLMEPLRLTNEEPLSKQSKRRASQFSLRSITDSFNKRPRLGLQKLASTVYEQGTKHIRHARWQWKQQAEKERREFHAWRARRRRDRPADVLKGRPEGGFGTFCLERSRYEHEPWWRDGVSRYQAPSWMMFPREGAE